MSEPVIIVGHKNPDNDSIAAAVGYAHLKNELARRAAGDAEPEFTYIPARLGPLPNESAWVLEEAGIDAPVLIGHVSTRVGDVMTPDPYSVPASATLMEAGRKIRQLGVRSLVVENADGTYCGIVSTRKLAERYVSATDKAKDGDIDTQAVADDLIASLSQPVSEVLESADEVLVLDGECVLKDTVDDLMGTSLREAVVLDDDNRCVGIMTRTDVASGHKRKVILVDHNELRQAADGLEDAEVVEIVDHHRIADVSTANPIMFLNMPLGSTATIISMEYERHGVELTPEMAKVLLSALLTDTVILKSPTTTDVDRARAEVLAKKAGVEVVSFGMDLFRARSGAEELTVEKIVGADSKEFQIGEQTVLIAQHETVDLQSVLSREDEIRAHMRALQEKNGYEFVLLMVTDILAEGSQFLCEGNRRIVNRVFGIECTGKGGTWMPGVLSRKKQVAAKILA